MKKSILLLRLGRRLLSLLAILALLLGALPAVAEDYPAPKVYRIRTVGQSCYFEWFRTPGALEYDVYRAVDGGSSTYLTSTTQDHINDENLEYGRVYTYTVRAVYELGQSSASSSALSTRPIATPSYIEGWELHSPGKPKVHIRWTGVSNTESYSLYRRGSDGSSRFFSGITQDKYDDDTDLQLGVTYFYTVFAIGLNSASNPSKTLDIKVVGVLETPQGSCNVVGNTVSLTWNPVPNAVKYEIMYIQFYVHFNGVIYYTTDTNFTLTHQNYDAKHSVVLTAYSANEAPSESSSIYHINALEAPELTGLSEYGPPTMPAVKLSWNAVERANNYQVYRSVDGGAYTFFKGTTGLSINDNSVQLGKTYYYKVKARRTGYYDYVDSESFLSALRGVKVKGVLAAPAISSLTSASNSAYLKWAPVAGAKSYAIYRSVNGGAFQFLKGTTGLFIADAGLTYGALHSYRVQAKADGGAASPMSASRSIRIPVQPATPAISSLSLAATTATLAWGTVNGAVSYYVYRSVNGGAYSFLKGTTATFIKDNNLETGKTYAYRVRANGNAGVYSALSAARSVKVTALGIPIIASLTNGGTTTATLTWGAVNSATSYTIYRSVNGGAYSFLKGTTATFIKDAGLSMGSSYAYRVQANGAGGLKSALSAARSITIE